MNDTVISYCAISIDTSYFENQKFNFEGPTLSTLKQFSKGNPIKFIISNIICKEIHSHLLKISNEMETAIKKYQKESSDNDTFLRNSLKETLENRFLSFMKSTGLHIIEASDFPISLDKIIDNYFEGNPPFSKNKKYEFPDAFALEILEEYGKSNNAKVVVVSKDPDWKNYSDKSLYLEYYDDLSDAITEINNKETLNNYKNKSILKNIEEKIKKTEREIVDFLDNNLYDHLSMAIERIDLDISSSSNSYVDYFNVDISDYRLESDRINTLSFQSSSMIVRIPIEIDVTISADFTYYMYSSLDEDDIGIDIPDVVRDETFYTDCIILIKKNLKKDTYIVKSLEFSDSTFYVDFGNVEPDFSEEYEY